MPTSSEAVGTDPSDQFAGFSQSESTAWVNSSANAGWMDGKISSAKSTVSVVEVATNFETNVPSEQHNLETTPNSS